MTPHSALRAASTTLTATVGGFMLSHSIVLGRFFDWSVENDSSRDVLGGYATFREARDPVTPYAAVCFAQLGAAALDLAATALRARREEAPWSDVWLGVPALCAMPALIAFHTASRFGEAETAVLSGVATDDDARRFVRLNLPIHIADAAVFLTAAFARASPRAPRV